MHLAKPAHQLAANADVLGTGFRTRLSSLALVATNRKVANCERMYAARARSLFCRVVVEAV